MTTAAFLGTFAPVTKGHVRVVRQALKEKVADSVIVVALINQSKDMFLTPENAVGLFKKALSAEDIARCVFFEARQSSRLTPPVGADLYIRGVRDARDEEHERHLLRQIYKDASARCCRSLPMQWIVDPPASEDMRISSTRVRNILFGHGPRRDELSLYLPILVIDPLLEAWQEAPPDLKKSKTIQRFNANLARRLG